jgi:hypothetical protein
MCSYVTAQSQLSGQHKTVERYTWISHSFGHLRCHNALEFSYPDRNLLTSQITSEKRRKCIVMDDPFPSDKKILKTRNKKRTGIETEKM